MSNCAPRGSWICSALRDYPGRMTCLFLRRSSEQHVACAHDPCVQYCSVACDTPTKKSSQRFYVKAVSRWNFPPPTVHPGALGLRRRCLCMIWTTLHRVLLHRRACVKDLPTSRIHHERFCEDVQTRSRLLVIDLFDPVNFPLFRSSIRFQACLSQSERKMTRHRVSSQGPPRDRDS